MIRIQCNEIEADRIIRALMLAPDCPGIWKCNGRQCEECIKDHIEFEIDSCFTINGGDDLAFSQMPTLDDDKEE